MRPSVPDVHITDAEDAELAAYRALAGQSVAGLIFGLLAPLVFVDPLLLAFPVLGVFFSGWALRRIKKNDSLAGRKMAMAGLALSLAFMAAAPSEWLAYRRMVRQEARRFSASWFQFLTQDEPQKALPLMMPPQARPALDDRLWAFYRNNPKQRTQLENSVKDPLVRTLLALGPRAQVRFYATVDQTSENDADEVEQWYAVTYDEDGEKTSFLVAVRMLRQKLVGGGAAWQIVQAAGGVGEN